jgi:hypothetical protein
MGPARQRRGAMRPMPGRRPRVCLSAGGPARLTRRQLPEKGLAAIDAELRIFPPRILSVLLLFSFFRFYG